MRSPKFLALVSVSALACLSPIACSGPEEQAPEPSELRQSRAALSDNKEQDDNGTRLSASPVGATRCEGEGAPSVNITGTVTTTGSVDSVELVASIDGAEGQVVGEIAPQDFVHRGRFKDAAYTVQVSVPAGQHTLTMCFVQSGAQGREEKQVCAEAISLDVNCAPTDGGSGGQDGGSGGGDQEPNDELPPVTVLAASPLANAAGWNNTDVTVTLTATDDRSGVKEIHWTLVGAENAQGVTPGDVAVIPFHNEGATTITYFAVDNAGNVEAAHIATLNIDKTAPVIGFGAINPAANAAGWNNTGVAVPFVVTDALSGVAGSSPASPLVFANEGVGQTGVVSAIDVAGNVASATSPALNIDLTAPVIVFDAQNPAANGAGWNNTPVSIGYSVSDALSGVAGSSPASPLAFAVEGAGLSETVTVVDVAGNVATAASPAVNIDWTAPVITFGAQSPAANAAGWNNTDVSIPYSVTDSLSGVAGSSPGSPVVFTGEGSGLTATVTAVDYAGNVSSAVTPAVNIDRTPPVIGGIPNTCTLWSPNHKLVLVADLSGSDGLSGFDSGSWNIQGTSNEPLNDIGDGNTNADIVISGTRIHLRAERAGPRTSRIYTVTADASDSAGNVAHASFTCTVPHDQAKK